ncbi:sushi, von Willebrand factor type A, EGF and pentraxin domain-containing protein 1 isoform X2 [Nematostella vectensis]|nr:sushi, von Willebrand factor type A, EGF and pentraxin domain-containing protein 1 isoform X2 [Nematostella vectensis]
MVPHSFIAFILATSVVSVTCQSNSSTLGYTLSGYVYKAFSAPDPHVCYEACKGEEPGCRSFNFWIENSTCQLNNQSSLTRPQNYNTSELCIYFHSIYRVRYGSESLSPAESCAEILRQEDSTGNGRYWIQPNASEPAIELYCNMDNGGNMSSSFDLLFPTERNLSNYVMIDAIAQPLAALTVCLWIKTTELVLVPISYAAGSYMNAILIFLDESGWLRFVVNDQVSLQGPIALNDNKWHHIAATWSNTEGSMGLYIDGALKINSTGRAVGSTIPSNGKLVLGLDKDSPGGDFDIRQSFAGELAHVYLWDTALDNATIADMSRECREFPYSGHVVAWIDFAGGIYGNITRRDLSRCHYDPLLLP